MKKRQGLDSIRGKADIELIHLATKVREQVSKAHRNIQRTVYPRAFHTPISAQMEYAVSALGLATMILTNVSSEGQKRGQ